MQAKTNASRLSRLTKGSQTLQIENNQGSDKEHEYIDVVVHQISISLIYFLRF